MTVVAITQPPPEDQQAWADEVERLRRERRFAAAISMCEEHDLDGFDDVPARAALVSRARIDTEYGAFAQAEGHYRQAAAREPRDPWLEAEADIYEYLHNTGRLGDADDIAQELREVRQRLRTRAETIDAPLVAVERAPFQWALGVIETGPHQDDDPTPAAIQEARRLLGAAQAALGGEGVDEARDRVVRAQARLAWVAARVARDRVQAIPEARHELKLLRKRSDDPHVALTIDYYEARIDMLDRLFERALVRLNRILERDRGHQAALVWRFYCERVKSGDASSLLQELDDLLPETFDEGTFEPAPPEASQRVFDRHLVAELLTERAAIQEDRDPSAAVCDYDRALAIRPRMVYAQRRRLDGLVEDGRAAVAVDDGQQYLDEHRAWSRALGTRVPCALLVDVGMADNAVGDHERALARFDEAIAITPSYGFAYEARFATRRLMARTSTPADRRRSLLEDAVAEGEAALVCTEPRLVGTGGLKVELGHACMTLGHERRAVEYFTRALADGAGVVRDRARAGLIDIHRITRRFEAAARYASDAGSKPGPRTLAASGWLYAEYGDLQGALEYFERALKEKGRRSAFIVARARTLRLLGRPTAARQALDKADVPPHRAILVDNEQAWTSLDLGRIDEAKRQFSDILRRDPSFEPAVRGRIAARSGAGAPWQDIELILDEASACLGGERPAVVAEAALARIRRRELTDARRLVEQACDLAPDDHNRVTLRLLAGNEYLVVGAYPDVTATLQVLRGTPSAEDAEDPRIALLQARLLTAVGDRDGGMEQFRRVGRTWSRSYYALMGQAFIHYQCERYAEAQRCLEDLLKISPDNVATLERLAWTLVQAHERESETGGVTPHGRYETTPAHRLGRAEDLCDRVRLLEPTRPGVLDCLATVAAMRGLAATADVYVEEARRHGAGGLETLRNRGAIYLRLGRCPEAVTTLEEAISHPDADAATRTLLGMAYLESDRTSDAAIELKQAVLGDPRDPTAPIALAGALEQLHRPDEARDVLSQAMRIVPRRDQLPLLLARARLLHAQATEKDGREAAVMIDDAMLDVCTANRIARRRSDAADVEYHRGVLLHCRGSRQAAAAAFKDALRLNPANADAQRAAALTAASIHSDPERLTRRWSVILGVAAGCLIVAAILMTWAQAGWSAAEFQWGTLNWTVGMLLVLLVVAATLPRLTGMEFGKQVKLSLNAAAVSEPMSVTLSFSRLTPVPPRLMAGPGQYGQYEMPSDTEGVD